MNSLLLLVTYTAKPGFRDEFVKRILDSGLIEKIRREDGFISYNYYLDADNPDRILLVEEWVSEAYQKKHMKTPHMAELAAVKDSCILGTEVRKIQL